MEEFFEEYGDMIVSGIAAAVLIGVAVLCFTNDGGIGFLRNFIEKYCLGAL